MTQNSAPIVGVNLADADWRDLFGDEAGVTGDLDGSSYFLSLAGGSDVAQIGSSTQRSTALVAGFSHGIPAGNYESITIPAASGAARTDIIALRYDPFFTGEPGPVRLVRIAGTSASLPAYDAAPPGIEDLPLWSVTRTPGQALSQATVLRLFPRLAKSLEIPAGAPLPTSSPLGTIVRQGVNTYRRQLDTNNVPVWFNSAEATPWVNLAYQNSYTTPNTTSGGHQLGVRTRDAGATVELRGVARAVSGNVVNGQAVATLATGLRPTQTKQLIVAANGNALANIEVRTNGQIVVRSWQGSDMTNAPAWVAFDGVSFDIAS